MGYQIVGIGWQSNGYTVNFDLYIGKATGQEISEFGLGFDVSARPRRPFLHQGY